MKQLTPDDFKPQLYLVLVDEGLKEVTKRVPIYWEQPGVNFVALCDCCPTSAYLYDRESGGEPLVAIGKLVSTVDDKPIFFKAKKTITLYWNRADGKKPEIIPFLY